MPAQLQRFDPSRVLLPVYDYPKAIEMPINLAPSVVLVAGTVLGQYAASVNESWTITVTGTPTSGTVTYTFYNPITGLSQDIAIAFNSTSAILLAQLIPLFGTGNVAVTGGALPGTALVVTLAGNLVARPAKTPVMKTNGLLGGTTPASTVAKTTTGHTLGTWTTYASGNSDGTQNPQLLLKYDCATDVYGRITFGPTAGSEDNYLGGITAPAYRSGIFRTNALTGLDANALSKMGVLISGTLADGLIKLF